MLEGVPGKDLAAVAQVISGRAREPGWRQPGSALRRHTRHNGHDSQELTGVAALWSLLDETGYRLGEIVKLISGRKSEIATGITHVRAR